MSTSSQQQPAHEEEAFSSSVTSSSSSSASSSCTGAPRTGMTDPDSNIVKFELMTPRIDDAVPTVTDDATTTSGGTGVARVDEEEGPAARRLRQMLDSNHAFHTQFWAQHNRAFEHEKAEFVAAQRASALGAVASKDNNIIDDDTSKSTAAGMTTSTTARKERWRVPSAAMGRFYKDFLDRHRQAHAEYNAEWWSRNIRTAALAAAATWEGIVR